MPDETPDDGYPVSARVIAAVGLVILGAFAYILLDVISNGKLAAAMDCKDCPDKDPADG